MSHTHVPTTTVKYVCKHCKVEVVGPKNFHPILGKEHKKNCPRRRSMG